jgi:branched-subunit amino acid ABC-type transport system permease component
MLVIGLTVGAMYGFIAVGVVLVYRTTRVLNVAHSGIGILSGFIAYDLIVVRGKPYYVGIAACIVLAALFGFLFERIILRRLHGQPLVQTGATLVLAIMLTGVSTIPIKWTESTIYQIPSPLAQKGFRVPLANQRLTYDQLVLLIALAVFTVGSYWVLKRTRVGLALRALADDPSTASLMGVRHQFLSSLAWTTSFALSALTTMLVIPMLTLDRTAINLITVKALTAAFVGSLVSVPLMAVGALALGLLEAASDLYWVQLTWLKAALPFILMVGYLGLNTARGRKVILEDAGAVTP